MGLSELLAWKHQEIAFYFLDPSITRLGWHWELELAVKKADEFRRPRRRLYSSASRTVSVEVSIIDFQSSAALKVESCETIKKK